MRVREYYIAYSGTRRATTKVYKQIKRNELKRDRKSYSNYRQHENDTRNRRNQYKDAAKFHNKMYPHNKLFESKELHTVLKFDMNINGKIYMPPPIKDIGQDITFT